MIDLVVHHAQQQKTRVFPVKNSLPIRVSSLSLLIHDLVIFEQTLALIKVLLFNLLLSSFHASCDHRARQRLPVFQSGPLHDSLHHVAGEESHEFVFEADEETAGSRVSLTSGTTSQLQVDSS